MVYIVLIMNAALVSTRHHAAGNIKQALTTMQTHIEQHASDITSGAM